MNIQYIGATENSNYKRFALIQYTEKEEEKVDRFALLMEQIMYKYFGEEECLYIEVEDKNDFNYIKYCFKAYKTTKMFTKKATHFSYVAMYEEAESDAEMYCFLVNEGRTESDIKDIMLEVSGANDAYYNALGQIVAEIF